ncbi:BON domain-containing protein [Cupriavidus sp. RAF12]|uniref:BON domain-containing protein n=1 Tax=Cupriavidus sp. RAF12 TaxID=3233050 RepID=UPI003F8DE052
MKSIHAITFAAGAALLALAGSFYTPLGQGQGNAPAASPTNPNPTHETVSEGMSDTAVTTKVKAGLLDQKNLSSMHIHVRTREGVVRLTGSVPSTTERQMATEVAKGVSGVKKVENHLGIHKS